MDIPISQIYRVATFYKAFSLVPKGKYHIKICMGTACHVRGSRNVLDSINQTIESAPENLFSVETVNCLGACASGPVMVVNEEYHGLLDPKKVTDILNGIIEEEGVE